MAIHLLNKNTINKIAAGEVIERPASVVKELVENSIDAGTDSVTVEIKDGGISYIRVTDKGTGIERDDIRNAFVKHATSKINKIDDLYDVNSLGFRGEALSSIAAVAKVELYTKQRGEITGYVYVIEGGEEKELSQSGVPEGCSFIVKDIFYNTPVRKKFLKSASSEAAAVNTLMERFALSRPDISFRYISNGVEKLVTNGNNNLKEVIYSIYGREISDNLIEINEVSNEVSIKGFVGRPAISRGNRSFENYSVNGRYIKNDSLTEAIEDAYKGFIMLHNYPFTALSFKIEPSLIDVNVHPSKREFRLTASEKVCLFVRNAIKNAIEKSNLVPDVVPEKNVQPSGGKVESVHVASFADTVADRIMAGLTDGLSDEKVEFEVENENTETTGVSDCFESTKKKENFIQQEISGFRNTNKYRLIGQLFATYWLIESDDTFYMMDQHAAHEKILYERLMKRVENKSPETQLLMIPEVIDINPETAQMLKNNEGLSQVFKALGYETEIFGENAVKVTGVPAGLPVMNYRQMITDVLDGLSARSGMGFSLKEAPQIMIEKLASMSCKAAIKGNDRISESEALNLLDEMMTAQNPYNCPHGRPTLIAMSKYEIEKKFKRIV